MRRLAEPMVWTQAGRLPSVSAAVDHTGIMRLYGAAASWMEQVKYDEPTSMMIWTGPGGEVSWLLNLPEKGDYEVALCYAAIAESSPVEISSSEGQLTGTVHRTEGFFGDNRYNFERVPLEGRLGLPAGATTIRIRLRQADAVKAVHLRSVELTRVAAKKSIAEEQEMARRRRASTDWFAEAGYGVMFHWTDQSAPRRGPHKGYAEAVRDFDVPAFVSMVQRTGAAYVLFTVNHADPTCPAPIKSWERAYPGWTTQRDLIAEIADALGKRGLKLLLYYAAHTLGWGVDYLTNLGRVDGDEFMEIHRGVLTEMGMRYGKNVAGYWFDGWYRALERYPNFPTEEFFSVCKAGHPDRIIALNFWIFPVETAWEDYWAGELYSPENPAKTRYIERGPAEGVQYHGLVVLDAPGWVHEKLDTAMPPPRFSDERVIGYVKGCMAKKVPVTMNLGIYQDGRIGEATLKQMESLRRAVRGS